jgi:hypothetical protein
MSKNKKKGENHLTLEDTILQKSENIVVDMAKTIKETQEKLQEAKEGERIEKHLKNEAYAFLLAEGLLDKFLEFREHFHRTKAQDALYSLVAEADQGGLWIDLS